MRQHQTVLRVRTSGRGFHDVTGAVREAVRGSGIRTGLAVLFCRHTSCSLVIQENYDPSAQGDLMRWLERIAPDGDPAYRHDSEGPDDMPSHLRSAVTKTSETIPVADGAPVLGTWQGILLAEHRLRPHQRELFLHVTGE
jgi:secondary thiamine-phosphate synthase enzyme